MQLNDVITLGDISSAITVLLIIVGGIFACYKWNKSIMLKRAEYINVLIEKTRLDENIRSTIYMFDYSENWYNKNFHNSGKLEQKVDVTLAYFSYICYLKKQRLISRREFKFFIYEITRILQNEEVQSYLYNLYHFSRKFKKVMSFQYLFEYGKKNNFFDKDFFNSASHHYKHYLNF